MSALQPVSGKSHAAGNETYDVVVVGAGFAGMYMLHREWDWSERYAPQPEILKYATHVADRFNLRPDIQFNTRVVGAEFNENADIWSVTTSDGKTMTAKYVVLATGCLSNAKMPEIKGLESFKGKVYHTGHWPHQEIDLTG